MSYPVFCIIFAVFLAAVPFIVVWLMDRNDG